MLRLCSRWLIVGVTLLQLLPASSPANARQYDLNGLYVGTWIDQGRNRVDYKFKLRITHDCDRISGNTIDKTVWIKGRLDADRIELEWDHSSGNYGPGYFDVLDQGRRLKGKWGSEGSGRFYGEWDLIKQD